MTPHRPEYHLHRCGRCLKPTILWHTNDRCTRWVGLIARLRATFGRPVVGPFAMFCRRLRWDLSADLYGESSERLLSLIHHRDAHEAKVLVYYDVAIDNRRHTPRITDLTES